MITIGITGTLGAGKGTVVEHFVRRYGYSHFSARDFIVEEVKRRGLAVNRDSMTEVANDLRRTHSPAYIIEELYKAAHAAGRDAVIESIRTLGEIEFLRKHAKPFYLFAVDADARARYARIAKRMSATDSVSFEKFLEDEKREMASDDPAKQDLALCLSRADYVFHNDGTMDELYLQVDEATAHILKIP